ncbi:MAG: leucine-rich repeat domain-containing protein [Pseudonocardiales bacterium]|nr:leucine-rich repeat domain-containing protein [Pseudonocardiales bacterium]
MVGGVLAEIEKAYHAGVQRLDLSDRQLTSLPAEIGKLRKLKILSLGRNMLTELPPEIGLLTNLKKLDLDFNDLTSLPKEIECLTKLHHLSFYRNKLTELPHLPPYLPSISQHLAVDAGCNFINKIPASIVEHKQLRSRN